MAHCRYGTGSTRTASGQRRGCRTAPLLRGRRCGCSKCFNRRALRRSVRESRHRPPGEPSDDLCVPARRRRPESAEPLLPFLRASLLSEGTLPEKEDCFALAGDLERWLHSYKELWRTVSKESELYRIAHVFCWYADLLRDLNV